MEISDRYRGCLLGLACGDAVGSTVEFCKRGSFKPVIDMVGGGPFRLPVGAWTDDTSMALCLAASLVELGRFDPADQMRRYCRWYDDGYLSSTGQCFDIGGTVHGSLGRFKQSGEPISGPTEPHSAGNGCIMRLAPIPLFFYPDQDPAIHWSGESSRTTHGALECIDACRLLAAQLCKALSGAGKEEVLFGHGLAEVKSASLRSIATGDYRNKGEAEIHGTGYVVKSLEAALWCFLRTDTFRDAILMAVNLEDDADTTGAVCGQLAGAYYGESGIPPEWLQRLVMASEIGALADRLGEFGC
jgi:ADP-ribosyl-[dinitrogen reductase] hydrolase